MRWFLQSSLPLVAAVLIGTVLVPAFLPWIPFRSFALKGALLGLVFVLAFHQITHPSWIERIAHLLIVPGLASYLALNFTGSTPFTSLSGVQKELAWGIPIYIFAGVAGLVLTSISLFF